MEGQAHRRVPRCQPPRPALAVPAADGRAADRRSVILRCGDARNTSWPIWSSGETLIVHLGMSGRMLIVRRRLTTLGEFHHRPPGAARSTTMSCSTWRTARGSPSTTPRRFGAMDLVADRCGRDASRCWPRSGRSRWATRFDEAYLVAALEGPQHADQGGAARPADRRRAGQHLCLRGAAPGRDLAAPQGRPHRCQPASRAAGPDHPRRADRGDRGGRLVAARLPAGRWRAGLFPAQLSASTAARAQPCRTPGCGGTDRADRAVRTVDLPLPALSKIA